MKKLCQIQESKETLAINPIKEISRAYLEVYIDYGNPVLPQIDSLEKEIDSALK